MSTRKAGYPCGFLACLGAVLVVSAVQWANASEVDPYTYSYVYLEDAAPALNKVLTSFIEEALSEVNHELLRDRRGAKSISDTEIEFRFFRAFEALHMQDVAFGVMEKCISSNNCDGWPNIERIQLRPEESIFYEAGWKFTPAKFYVSSVVNVCGVRFGADKLTHFFDDGFRYYNASRSKRLDYSIEELQHLSMVFERTWMGAVLTGVVSYADIEANIMGVRFYRSLFFGEQPLLRRTADGELHMERPPDICDFISERFDERVLENDYVFSPRNTRRSRAKVRGLARTIEERRELAVTSAMDLEGHELDRLRRDVLARSAEEPDWRRDYPKWRLVFYAFGYTTRFVTDRDFRKASMVFARKHFRPRRLKDRKVIEIAREFAD